MTKPNGQMAKRLDDWRSRAIDAEQLSRNLQAQVDELEAKRLFERVSLSNDQYAVFMCPRDLSDDDFRDLEGWMTILIRKLSRCVVEEIEDADQDS